jgi:hypothetical protein
MRHTGNHARPQLFRAAWRGPAAVDPYAGRRRHFLPGEVMLISCVIGFGVTTLFGTGLLFVMQMLEDFRDV